MTEAMLQALRVAAQDDVAVTVRAVRAGETLSVANVRMVLAADIPAGHKVALRTIAAGSIVTKFGAPIGRTTVEVRAGEHVHSHNLVSMLEADGEHEWPGAPLAAATRERQDAWRGYRRADGRAATRNDIWILPTVGCVNALATRLATLGRQRMHGRIDGIHAFPHPYGCSQLGDDLERTRRLLAGLARNPNAGGVLLVGLGCENNRLSGLLDALRDLPAERLIAFDAQAVEDEEVSGLEAIDRLIAVMQHDRRISLPLSDLVVGTKCGGSDGFSGLTANPVVGGVAEQVTAAGGFALLSEVPEMFGAETSLLDRTVTRAVHDDAQRMINGFKQYYRDNAQPIHENPSPGNKDGGITTLEEKSLGATQKGGRAPVIQVVEYADAIRTDGATSGGLVLVGAPGNDAVSTTALTAAGATVILFTTGRGTPLGAPVPTIKIASTTELARRKPRWIDFDAGVVLTGTSRDAAADALLAKTCAVASGDDAARHEESDVREIAVWKQGVTL